MSKTVLVTGANRGIGLSFCQHYADRGDKVYALCRQSSDELRAMSVSIIEDVDVTNTHAIEKLMALLAGETIDILINNAGILRNEVLGKIDYDTINSQFLTNAVAPLRITEALLPNLVKGSKVALITSRMGSVSDNSSGGRYGYRMSKAALNIAGVSLAKDLFNQGIAVGIYHPGLVGTEMIQGYGDIGPDEAAIRLIGHIDRLSLENTGQFYHSNGENLPW